MPPLSIRDLVYTERNFSDDYFLLGHLGLPLPYTTQISPGVFRRRRAWERRIKYKFCIEGAHKKEEL